MQPYIEYNGEIYEFEGNFNLEKKYNKDIQNFLMNSMKKNKNKFDLKKINEVKNFINTNKIDEETLKNNPEMQENIDYLLSLMENIDVSEINEKYCYLLLNNKYGISKETWEDMQKQFVKDYGFEYLNLLFTKVIEKVFSQKEEEREKKPLPDWMNE